MPSRLQATNLQCIRGERQLFRNLHCKLQSGDCLQVHGENGAGKTSLLRILCGLTRPHHGEVHWNGIPILQRPSPYSQALAYIGHTPPLNGTLTARQNLQTTRALMHPPPDQALHDQALRELGINKFQHIPCRLLSAGQRQRIALAAVLMKQKRGGIWILDEPATALDAPARRFLTQMLRAQTAAGGIVIFTAHQNLLPKSFPRLHHLHLEKFQ